MFQFILDRLYDDIRIAMNYFQSRPLTYAGELRPVAFASLILLQVLFVLAVIYFQSKYQRYLDTYLKSRFGINKFRFVRLLYNTIWTCLVIIIGLEMGRLIDENHDSINKITVETFTFIVDYPITSSIICFSFGALAYLIRCRARIIYAVLELGVGVIASYSTSGFSDAIGAIQFLGGIYIIVRAFDNFNKGLEQSGFSDGWWSYIFGENR